MCSHNINQRAPCFHIPFIVSFFRSFSIIDKKNQPQHQRREKKKGKKNPVTRFLVTPLRRLPVYTRFTDNRLHAQYTAQYANFERRSDRRWRLIRSHLLAISASKKAE